jgi:2-(1,2-epoxy-1,2-dihydrophenyl)acetyl-CoA isomerase
MSSTSAEMSTGLPDLSIEDCIATVTFRDPATLNGLSPAVFTRLGEIFIELTARAGSDVRAVVLTGSGRAFSAGAELNSIFRSAPADRSVGQHIADLAENCVTPTMMALHHCPLPLVSAINGVAAGIGMSIALKADVVVAARSASFVVPFMTGLGIVPDGGLTWQLPRLVGYARASAMCLLGERLSAEAAVRSGLIWQCVDDDALLATAHEVARRLSRLPAYACAEIRAALAQADEHDYTQQYHYELDRNVTLLEGHDFLEGITAFLEKRAPRYPS